LIELFLVNVLLRLGMSSRHASGHTLINFFLLMGPNHCWGCSHPCWVSAAEHVPSSQTNNDCDTLGLVQSWQTTCYSHDTTLFLWWQQLLEAEKAGSDVQCCWEVLLHVAGRSFRLWHRANAG
jgi:hypothetical protein